MIEYKRFISYIYAYAGGVRDKNTGFAKAQVQRQKFELAINLSWLTIANWERVFHPFLPKYLV